MKKTSKVFLQIGKPLTRYEKIEYKVAEAPTGRSACFFILAEGLSISI
jgi:hypothetical protein